ncbi:MAG: nucleotidyltransferase [bacterium]|nr:nucleotidyltransferase [bacterium]MDE0351165.1 nucleotidyltransferase [bacterium]
MANNNLRLISQLLGSSVEALDISAEQYELAVRRYKDLGSWLVAQGIGDPDVYPQGSFRLGTVVRPTIDSDFDIDLVFLRYVAKESITQNELRAQVGKLLRSYMRTRGDENGNPGLEEKGRCWTLVYADDEFHMDVLPVIPDPDGDDTAILLSDRDLRQWQHSNPIGYADWFWRSMGDAVEIGRVQLAATLSRDVEDVPRWLVRTPLQRVVQLLKLHRDTFFHDQPRNKPASILITTLATHAYGGETDLYEAYRKIAHNLHSHIEWRNPEFWVPNPAHEDENFADKWNTNPALKAHFDRWTQALIADADRWIVGAGVDEAVRSLSTSLGNAPVEAGAKRVATRLSSATAAGALAVTQSGKLTHGRGTKIPRHDFYGQ